jgi:hypothetical protein
MRKAEVGLLTLTAVAMLGLLTLTAVAMLLPVACKCFDGAM